MEHRNARMMRSITVLRNIDVLVTSHSLQNYLIVTERLRILVQQFYKCSIKIKITMKIRCNLWLRAHRLNYQQAVLSRLLARNPHLNRLWALLCQHLLGLFLADRKRTILRWVPSLKVYVNRIQLSFDIALFTGSSELHCASAAHMK